MKFLHFLLFSQLTMASFLTGNEMALLPNEEPQTLTVHNRILAKINDKTISVIDVMKKMDVYLNRAYPHLANSPIARYQFYSANWLYTLEQMIDGELIMLDVGEKDLKLTDGEVHETIQNRFGPNVMVNLDQLGLTYEEAKKMIYSELVVQRMTWIRIYSKTGQIKPQELKNAYREYCIKNPPTEEWKYQVVSIRSKDKKASETYAFKAYEILQNQPSAIASLAEQLNHEKVLLNPEKILTISHSAKEDEILSEPPQVTVSEEYELETQSLSNAHKDVLSQMYPGTFSAPVEQVSRADNSIVYRIFYLKDHVKKETPSFEQVARNLEDDLIDKFSNDLMKTYLEKLREKFGYDARHFLELIPSDFQPFTLN